MVSKKDYLKIFILRTVGNFLLLSAVSGVVLTFLPAISAEISYRWDLVMGKKYVVVEDRNLGQAAGTNLLTVSANVVPISPLDSNFGVIIPKIGANARVIANVDAGNFNEYIQALKFGVAHARGTVFPGEIGNSFLFAHSVGNFWEVNQWNAVFYLLRELSPGDEVDLFYKGRRYVYVVYDKKVVEASDVGYLVAQANFPMLTLQTCWPPGTTLKRLLVFARLKSS